MCEQRSNPFNKRLSWENINMIRGRGTDHFSETAQLFIMQEVHLGLRKCTSTAFHLCYKRLGIHRYSLHYHCLRMQSVFVAPVDCKCSLCSRLSGSLCHGTEFGKAARQHGKRLQKRSIVMCSFNQQTLSWLLQARQSHLRAVTNWRCQDDPRCRRSVDVKLCS